MSKGAPIMPPPPESPAVTLDKLVEVETKLIGTTFEKASAYANLVIVAGYATFFGLWALTKPFLGRTSAQLAAIFMAASAASFVFFEVFKMMKSASQLVERRQRLNERIKGKPPAEVLAEYQRLELEAKEDIASFIPKWRVSLLFSLVTGAIGIGILFIALIYGLFSGAV